MRKKLCQDWRAQEKRKRDGDAPSFKKAPQRVIQQDFVPLLNVDRLVRHLLPERGDRVLVDGLLEQL